MSTRIISKSNQAYGAFNGGQIVENKPIGFPQDGGFVRPYSNLFYWARAKGVIDSTIGLHPHQGFEIMSFVLEGKIRHFDTKMNAWKELEAGSAQIIRSGNGIQHAEHLHKDAVIFQIWVDPNLSKTLGQEASYDDYTQEQLNTDQIGDNHVTYYAGPNGNMHMDAEGVVIEQWKLYTEQTFELNDEIASIYQLEGHGLINGETFEGDDFAIVENESQLTLSPGENGMTIFMIKSPAKLSYRTYAEQMLASA